MGPRIGATGYKRYLGSSLGEEIQLEIGWRWRPAVVDACQGRQAIQDRNRRGITGCKNSSAYQYKGSRRGVVSTCRVMGTDPGKS